MKHKSAGGRGPVVVVKPRSRCVQPDCNESGMVRCPVHLDLRCPLHFHKHSLSCRVAPRLPRPMPSPSSQPSAPARDVVLVGAGARIRRKLG